MDFLNDIANQGRRIAVDLLNGGGIERDSPWSPDVPDDLRESLPDLFDRFPLVLPWDKPTPVDPAFHTVWILDNTAYPATAVKEGDQGQDPSKPADIANPKVQPPTAQDSNRWAAEFIACYFVKNSGREGARVAAAVARQLDVADDDDASRKRIAARLQPFLDAVLPNRTLPIQLGTLHEHTLGPSTFSGTSSQIHTIQPTTPPSTLPTELQTTPANLPPPFSLAGTTTLASSHGWGVISDIDDTIKVTMTPSVTGILHSTFLTDTPEPISGMPDLYTHVSQTLHTPTFFYLSASPYPLYPFLRRFRTAHYPPGPILLRDATWQNLGGLVASLRQNVQEYKVSRMKDIHSWFPHRTFICVGDSTQSDPEAYGEIARMFPGWVRAVFVRKVTGIAEMDEREKNSEERFEKAFRGVERGLWHVFTEPAELVERVEELARDPGALVGGV